MGGTAWVMPMVAATQPGEVEDKKPLPLATNSLLPNTVPVVTRLAMMLMPPPPMLMLPLPCSRGPSLVCPGRITPSTPRSQSQDLLVTVRLMEVTTRTPRLSARRSTSATGGSTLTAPPLRSSTLSTTRSLQRGTLLQVMDWGPTEGNQSTELLQNTQGMLLSMRGRHLPGGEGGWEGGGGRGGGVKYSMKRERRALTMELTDGTESKD